MRQLFLLLSFVLYSFGNCNENSLSVISSDSFVQKSLANRNECTSQDIPCECPPHLLWARFRYTSSEGIGQKKGYTSFDLFNGLMGTENGLIFTDLRGHIFDDGKWAFNAGIGIRYRFDWKKIIGGANFFFDYRRNSKNHFTQIGLGYEVLGRYLGFRMNGYIPFEKIKKFKGVEFNRFAGNRLIYDQKFTLAMYGVDADFSGRLCRGKNLDVLLGVTPYYFKGSFGKSAVGAKARVEVEAYETIGGMIRASYDKVFKFNIQGEARLKFAFGPRVKRKKKTSNSAPSCITCCDEYLINKRLVDPLDRQEIIVLSDQKREKVAADANGDSLNFIFVNNLARLTGSGLAENPFSTLASAESTSSVGDYIYVFSGTGGTTGYRNGFTFKDNQSLLGSADAQSITTSDGVVIVPVMSSKKPTIINTTDDSDIITLANNNVLSGFSLVGLDTADTRNGVFASGPTVASTIINNEIFDPGDLGGDQGCIFIDMQSDVQIQNTFVIQNNIISSSEGGIDGIRIDTAGEGVMSINLDISNNEILGIGSNGVRFLRASGTGETTVSGVMNNNIISSNAANGFISEYGGGIIPRLNYDMTVNDNIFKGNASEGIQFQDITGRLSISNNVLSGNGGTAALFVETGGSTTLNLEVVNNQTTDNNGVSGIEIQADDSSVVNATFTDNITVGGDFEFDSNNSSTIRVIFKNNQGLLNTSGNVILEE